jgi:hypothetical protein
LTIFVVGKKESKPWRRDTVVIAAAYRTEDPGFKSRQGARFLGIYALQCCCHNLICIVIVLEKKKRFKKYLKKESRLTLSDRLYHLGDGSSRASPAMGSMTSPRKSFLPNMSLCHTLIHMVRRSTSSRGIWNWKSGPMFD